MLSYLIGKIAYKSPTEIVLDVNGVGYSLNISLTCYEKISSLNGEVKVYTYLHVREDMLQLYGFADEDEREMFKLLISVSGIGPKMAQGILSGMNADELKAIIQNSDIATLMTLQGIGKKTAERIVVELRDKISKTTSEKIPGFLVASQSKLQQDALNALLSLGYTRQSAILAIQKVLKEQDTQNISLEELIKSALRHA